MGDDEPQHRERRETTGAPGGSPGDAPGWAPRTAADGGAGPGKRSAGPGRRTRTGRRRFLPSLRLVLGGFIGVILLGVAGFLTGYLTVDIPDANANATAESNVYLYADGGQLARDGDVNRENIPLGQVPEHVQHSVLAAEDRDFYEESAVDPQAMVRAAWNTATGKGRQSGSTITQQYVKNYYLGQEQTVTRKFKEFFISIKLDREQSKQEILQGYLNTSFFGRNAYGIQAAAQAYYGVDAAHLTTAQGAYLASLLNAPSVYDVVAHPENTRRAVARWNYVLDGMVQQKWLSRTERAGLSFPVPHRAKNTIGTGMAGQRGYIVRAVKEYLQSNDIISEKELATGGHRITTTLQRGKQNALTEAVDEQLLSLRDSDRPEDRNVRAGGVALDPADGDVVAMYGGVDYTKQYVNNATRRDYQVGSSFKPFVFTAAVEHRARTQDGRRIGPHTKYDGTSSRTVQGWSGERYAPENEDKKSYGQLSVKQATDKSVNAVYAQMAADVGPQKVLDTAVALGIPRTTPDLTASPSLALGTATASPLDLAQAYATLADHGEHHPYTLVTKVAKKGEKTREPARHKPRQAVSRASADTTTAVLRGVVEGGTGTAAQSAGRPAAGKTGTAEEDTAAWFAGYTPDLATVITVMGQNPASGSHTPLYGALGQARINGGGYPAAIWGQFTEAALEGRPARAFDLRLAPGATKPDPSDSGSASPSPSEEGEENGREDGYGDGEEQEEGTREPGTETPGTEDPGTDDPGTDDPGTAEPSQEYGEPRDEAGSGESEQRSPETPAGGSQPFWRPERLR
ncbi:transglycosylase domain-containing protein [Streptomyces physcomitrii]|nr:transglycosylase domain-containing protein [Streptomyces physcomitrii]